MKKLLTLPLIMAATLAVALIGVTWLLATPAQAHNPDFLLVHNCGSYTLRINLLADANDPQDHRVIVTDNASVVAKRDITGVSGDFLNYLTLSGTLPASDVIDVFVFTKVDGSYVYNPDINALFFAGVSVGQNGLEAFKQQPIQLDNTCTPTPVPTATATQVPPTPTQTAADRCIATGGVWTATGCSAPSPTATATPVPPVTVVVQTITPPNTGDAGLKR